MLRFEFSFHEIDAAAAADFQLGDITIRGDHGIVTSKGRTPDQSMMLVISLAELMNGIVFLLSSSSRGYEFIGADSSFRVTFRKEGPDRVLIIHDGRVIHACSRVELRDRLMESTTSLARDNDVERLSNASEFLDFHDAMESFAALRRS